MNYENDMCLQWDALVGKVIHTHGYKFLEHDDLLQIGRLGLLRAIRTFDESQGVLFKTYAYTCIRRELNHEWVKFSRVKRHTHNIKENRSFDQLLGNDTDLKDIIPDVNIKKPFGFSMDTLEYLIRHSGMNKKDKELSYLMFVDDIQVKDIADELGVSRQRVAYKKQQLAKKIKELIVNDRYLQSFHTGTE